MATYKDLVGTAVRNNAGNIPAAETGQVWFDSTNIDFKYLFPTTLSSWRSGNNMNTARDYLAGSNYGSQTATLAFGGETPPKTAVNESYNGTSWTEVADLNTARRFLAGTGTQPSAIAIGGDSDPGYVGVVETWNGSAWTEVADLNTTRRMAAAAGADNTAALAIAGRTAPPAIVGNTESWNGSAWTEVADLNTARERLGGTGTSTSAIGLAGYDGTTPGYTAY